MAKFAILKLMSTIPAIAIQIGLIFGPVVLFFLIKSRFVRKRASLVFALVLSLLTGWVAFYFASEYGWQPRAKSGRTMALPPALLFWVFALGILIVLLLFILVKPAGASSFSSKEAAESKVLDRGWRVGHRGRDSMFYEEFREGAWHQITIDGEMLMGLAHHVIYFLSPEKWSDYPDWAGGRRDEIIARIKSEFTEPDYEYYGA